MLLLLGVAFLLPQEQELDQALAASTLGQQVFILDPDFAFGAVGMIRTLVQIGALIAAAAWLNVVLKMRQGFNWARQVLATFGALHIVAMLSQLVQGPLLGTSATALIVLAALSITEFTAVVMMFHPATGPFFRSKHRPR